MKKLLAIMLAAVMAFVPVSLAIAGTGMETPDADLVWFAEGEIDSQGNLTYMAGKLDCKAKGHLEWESRRLSRGGTWTSRETEGSFTDEAYSLCRQGIELALGPVKKGCPKAELYTPQGYPVSCASYTDANGTTHFTLLGKGLVSQARDVLGR